MKDNWIQLPILDVTSLIKDGTHATHKDVPNGIPMLSAKDIVGGNVLLPDDARLISEMDFSQIHKTYKLQKDDVLLTLVGTIGRVAILKDYTTKFTFQRSVGILRFDEKVIPEYAYYYVSSEIFYNDLIRSMNASAQGGVYLGELGKIKICFPKPLPQQQKTAKILSTVDRVIEKTESAIAKYQAIKQGLIHDLFTRGIDVNTGKLRSTPQEAPELYKESALGWIPLDWNLKTFSEILDITTGNKDTQDRVDNGKYPFYVRSQKVEKINSFSFDGIGILTAGDGVGTGKVFHFVNGKIAIHQRVYLLYNFKTDIIPEYVYEYFKLNFIHRVEKYSAKNTVDSVRLEMISEMLIPISKEQEKISKILININDKIQTEQQALAKYQQLKAGLLQDLLTGKVEVSV